MRLFPLAIRFGALGCLLAGLLATMENAAWSVEPPESAPPLLVVVETGQGAGCDAAAVRGAIAAELRARVIAPMSSPVVALAGPRAEVLLVAIDRERIVVTLRGRDDQEITRAVPAPADRTAKLRVVAWLAGNLARDQIAPLTVTAALDDDGEGSPATPVPTLAPPSTEPPPVPTPTRNTEALPAVIRSVPREAPSEPATWIVSLSGGPAAMFSSPWESQFSQSKGLTWNDSWQLEAQRHSQGPLFVGVAIDVGPRSVHPVGMAALAGVERRGQRLFVTGALGVGLQAFLARTYYVASSDQRDGVPYGGDGYVTDSKPVAYFRATVGTGLRLTAALDVLAQLGGHLAVTQSADAAFAQGTVGLRLRLP